MESAYNNNNHHQQLQDDQVVVVGSSSSSSSSSSSNYYGVVGTTYHPWGTTPTSSFMTTNINGLLTSYPSEPVFSTPPDPRPQYTAAAPDMTTFHSWPNAGADFTSVQDLQLPRIKDEFSNHYYHKYVDLLNEQDSKILQQAGDFGTKLLLKSYSSESLVSNNNNNNNSNTNNNVSQISPGDLYGRRYNTIFPSINVSSLNQMGLANGGGGSNLDMDLEALDLLTSSSFSGNLGNYSQSYQIGILRDHAFSNYDTPPFDDHTQQSPQIPLYDTNKISAPSSHGRISVETKRRSSNKIEAKVPSQNATKKSRLEARAPCPPFKVTKEKLGDRIATLQQLVAPFGKTDTASVLMEAIGYIKFLQDQVETLSVPYMKASRNKSTTRSSIEEGLAENQNRKDRESKRDLRSRGLCLVPLSCLSYITDGGAAVVWPPPHFGGPA